MDSLPDEILLEIFKKCCFKDILNVSQTNRRLKESCQDELLWQYLCKRDYGVCSQAHYSSFQIFYRKFLQKWGHLMGTYLIKIFNIGGLVEVKYINNSLVGLLWIDSSKQNEFPLEEEVLFTIQKHPTDETVQTICHFSETPHDCCFIKNFTTRNYMFKCDKYEEHKEGSNNLTYSTMLLIHDLRSGIELKPLLLPARSNIPKDLLLNDGTRPCQLIEPGIFQEFTGNTCTGIYVFHYKNANELLGSKITGSLLARPEETTIKIFLKYAFVASKEQQSSGTKLDDIEVKMNRNIRHVSELQEQEFYPLEFSELVLEENDKMAPCKARYHGRGALRRTSSLFSEELVFSKIHFIVFNNNLSGIILLPEGTCIYYKRIQQAFEKSFPQEDLNYRAVYF